MQKTFVISLGGSLVAPKEIDINFLKRFHKFIMSAVGRGYRFVIVVGGGAVARDYQRAARTISGKLVRDDLDWLGIHATRLNAHLLRTIFRNAAEKRVVKNPLGAFYSPFPKGSTLKGGGIYFKKPILIAAGWKPGASTDYDAVLLARKLKAKLVINLTDTPFVYDRDPERFKNARPFKELTWKKFRSLFGSRWDPGLSTPFDPVAARAAERAGISVAVIKGNNFKALQNVIEGKNFRGSLIG